MAAGAEAVLGMNHWPVACESYATNHQNARVACADVVSTDPRAFPTTDLLLASPECFPAGTHVLTFDGQKPIEDIAVGDVVLTHKGRWRKVVRTQTGQGDTVLVKGQGHSVGIEVTPNHKFWLRSSERRWVQSDRQYRRRHAAADFAPVGEAIQASAFWSTPAAQEKPTAQAAHPGPPEVFGSDERRAWYLVGRWVADGSLTFDRGRCAVNICCGFHEEDELSGILDSTGYEWGYRQLRTAALFTINDVAARDWLSERFGHGARNKHLPGWVLGMPVASRDELLRGYLDGDGHDSTRRVEAQTVSHRLALDVRLLAESLGYRCGLYRREENCSVIEGREVDAAPIWRIAWEANGSEREAFFEPGGWHSWSRIRSVEPCRTDVTVYNIEVEEDHSYVAEGIVVKNCTHHSYARGRPKNDPSLFDPDGDMGAERSRATMWDVIRFTECHQYKAVIVENVEAAIKWGLPKGRKLTPGGYGPLFHAWLMGMTGLGYEHKIVHLNSMMVGVPQSRDRLYVVFWRKGIRRPDLDLQPTCFCGHCSKLVHGQQKWRRPGTQTGTYGSAYDYACPTCFARVAPVITPAAAAIDWALPAQRISERTTPLKPNTMARIRRGLDNLATRPDVVTLSQLMGSGAVDPDGLVVQTGGNLSERPGQTRAWGTDVPFKVVTGTADRALVVPTTHSGGPDRVRTTDQVLPTATSRQEQALVVPNNTHNVPQNPDGQPLGTVTTGNRHALVVANREHAVPKNAHGEPLQTVVTQGGMYVAETPPNPDAMIYAGRDTAVPRPAHEAPMQTQTAINSLYVVDPMQIDLRGTNRARPVDGEPTSTIHAGGSVHGLAYVVANYSPGWTRDAALRELGTITSTDSHSLLTYRGERDARSANEPASTLTSHAQHALLGHRPDPSEVAVEDCSFRMLQPHELQAAQGFRPEYVVTGSKRDRIAQVGNAVSPPAATALVGRVLDAIAGS